tara:strand:- start:5 stop:505 length:501 start_codon:yes stop_codon:yes gene_type:complete
MSVKQFKNDKNYILKKIQLETKDKLLKKLIKMSSDTYINKSNPLGLIDKTTIRLNNIKKYNLKSLNFFYNKLSAIYRYNYGEVQLSFLWDGSSHEEYYRNRWISFFVKETNRMLQKLSFLKYVLYLTIFSKDINEKSEVQYKLSTFLRKDFNIQVFKRKGIVVHSK